MNKSASASTVGYGLRDFFVPAPWPNPLLLAAKYMLMINVLSPRKSCV
jgi:hypothetical protein